MPMYKCKFAVGGGRSLFMPPGPEQHSLDTAPQFSFVAGNPPKIKAATLSKTQPIFLWILASMPVTSSLLKRFA
jgi:hypothetical protein